MSKLTKLARDRECQVRLVGICNRDPATTVLAHYRLAGTCGMGVKPNNLQGAWACSACHDACDGRAKTGYSQDELRLMHLEGVMRTIDILVREGSVAA
ncbi:DUF1364 domain-containing protein [Pseudomonas cavernicola]|uniref:DUF1364 domain-containing protein n=1 Tax=Pseudomonas cavernicola TaxID=2320866 RepID=A0A418XEV9_9PSED|nr:DUF1364 domain-containing protein [Pseudomonas cavernicola]RJG10937.1 DUF1364 domain-containing protein [Pseudomonas cavernicola]